MPNDYLHISQIESDTPCHKCSKLLVANSIGVIFDSEIICLQCAFSITTNTIEELNKFLLELEPFYREELNGQKSSRTR